MEASWLMATVQPGGYISILKVIPLLLVVLVWARLMTWVDKDAPAAHLPRDVINLGLLVGGILGLALFLWLPTFLIAFPVLLLVMLAEAGVYLGLRHQRVGLGDLQQQFGDWARSLITREKPVRELPGQVQLLNRRGSLLPAPDAEAPERPAYDAIQSMLTEPLRRNAEKLEVVPSSGASGVRYYVDGVAYSGGELDRTQAAAAITYLKDLGGLDLQEKRKPQTGQLRVMIDGNRKELEIETRGSAAGEAMTLIAEPGKRHALTLEDLGFSEQQMELVRDSIAENSGIVLLAAPKNQGLTTLLYAIIRAHDAFLSHIHTIEREPDQDLEGITQNRLPVKATGDEESEMVAWVCSQEPDVVLLNQVDDPRTAAELVRFAGTGRRVYVGMRAGNTFEALNQWRKLLRDDKAAMKNLSMIISGRLVRRLCMACKVAYAPDPVTLRKLNLDPQRVDKLYQARQAPLRDAKGNPIACEFCHDLRYKGRIGVYEIFVINDDVREAVRGGASSNQLRAIFRKQRGRFLQERALAAVEQGETSIQEVLRVMKAGGESPPPAGSAPAPAPTPAPAPVG